MPFPLPPRRPLYLLGILFVAAASLLLCPGASVDSPARSTSVGLVGATATDSYASFWPPAVQSDGSVNYNYDITYVRVPKTTGTTWAEVFNLGTGTPPGSDLMLLHPDGSQEVLVAAGSDALADPYVSFDASSILFTRYYAGKTGSDVYRVTLTKNADGTRTVTQLTKGGYSPNRSTDDTKKYPVWNSCPCPLANGRVMFCSNRNAYRAPMVSGMVLQLFVMDADGSNVEKIGHLNVAGAMHPVALRNGTVMFSSDETQGNRLGEDAWSLWTINPDGTGWGPLWSMFNGGGNAFHFATQLSNGSIVAEQYYNGNDSGFGSFGVFPEPAAAPNFSTSNGYDTSQLLFNNQALGLASPGFGRVTHGLFSFQPNGLTYLTQFCTEVDAPSPLSIASDASSPRVGKVTHPCAAPDNHLLLTWTAGGVGGNSPVSPDPTDAGIYLLKSGTPAQMPNQMRLVFNDPNYHEIWPRPVVPYARIFGQATPTLLTDNPNDGSIDPALPAGTPYGIIGTASLYKRESFPNGIIAPGTVTSAWNGTSGLDPKLKGLRGFSEPPTPGPRNGNQDSLWGNLDIHAIRILAMEPTSDPSTPFAPGRYDGSTYGFVNTDRERLRIIGEIPVRKYDATGKPVWDKDGNPDTSFKARIPANMPFTFELLDKLGMTLTKAKTWHQLRPGERRMDCGGCHAHSQVPTDWKLTAAGQPGYKLFDLVKGTTLLTDKAGDTSGQRWSDDDSVGLKTISGVKDVEFWRHVKPILDRSCVQCHGGTNPAAGLKLDDTTKVAPLAYGSTGSQAINVGIPKNYAVLASNYTAQWGGKLLPNPGSYGYSLSYYVRGQQSRRSLLTWQLFGQRLDGWSNDNFATPSTPGDLTTLQLAGQPAPKGYNPQLVDVDWNGKLCPPAGAVDSSGKPIPPLSADEKRDIARWIDLGCPLDLTYDPASGTSTKPGGWFQDDTPPALTISLPLRGSNPSVTSLSFGLADYYSGLDPASLSVTADFPLDGQAAGSNLASLFSSLDGVYTYQLKTPIASLPAGNLTIKAADRAGNRVALTRTFSVAGNASPPPPPVPLNTQTNIAAALADIQASITSLQDALNQLKAAQQAMTPPPSK